MRQTYMLCRMPVTDVLITSPTVGGMLHKSIRTVQRMADAGELPVAQKLPGPNGAYLFRLADIEALVAGEHAAGAA